MSSTLSSSVPAADWYPDNDDPTQLRWWDGGQWTAHTAPRPGSGAQPSAQPVDVGVFGLGEPEPIATPVVVPVVSVAPNAADYQPNPTYAYVPPAVGAASAAGVAVADNRIGTNALIFSLIGIVINPLLALSVTGIVLGVVGLSRARQFPPARARRGQAIAAVIVGVVVIIVDVVVGVYVYGTTHRALP